jgi:hypothetical protein
MVPVSARAKWQTIQKRFYQGIITPFAEAVSAHELDYLPFNQVTLNP